MNLDRTFCTGARCARALTCERWEVNLEHWIKAQPEFRRERLEQRPFSIASFADHDGNCTAYEPMEDTP